MHEATIGRFIPGQHVTNGRHLCRVTDAYGLEYLDGTGYGAKLDDSWQVVVVDVVGARGAHISLDMLADALNDQNALIEPEHRFGDVYLLGHERVVCVFPGTTNAWATAYAKRRLTWSEVTENLDTRYGVEPQGNLLGGDRFTLDAVRERPSFGCVTPLGGGTFAIYAFPGTRRPWAVSGTRSRTSFDDLEAWGSKDDQGPAFAGQVSDADSQPLVFNAMPDAVRDGAEQFAEAMRNPQTRKKLSLPPLPDLLTGQFIQPGVKIAQDLADKISRDALNPLALARDAALKTDEVWTTSDPSDAAKSAFDRLLRHARQGASESASTDDLRAEIESFNARKLGVEIMDFTFATGVITLCFGNRDARPLTARYPSIQAAYDAVKFYELHPELIFGQADSAKKPTSPLADFLRDAPRSGFPALGEGFAENKVVETLSSILLPRLVEGLNASQGDITATITGDKGKRRSILLKHTDGRFRRFDARSAPEACRSFLEATAHLESIFDQTDNTGNFYELCSRYSSAFPGSWVSVGSEVVTVNHRESESFVSQMHLFRDEEGASAFIREKLGL